MLALLDQLTSTVLLANRGTHSASTPGSAHLHSEFEGVSLPGLWVGWYNVKMATYKRHCTLGTLTGVLEDQITTPLHKVDLLHFEGASILDSVWGEYVQQMLDGPVGIRITIKLKTHAHSKCTRTTMKLC